jgi:hypothetical protein
MKNSKRNSKRITHKNLKLRKHSNRKPIKSHLKMLLEDKIVRGGFVYKPNTEINSEVA